MDLNSICKELEGLFDALDKKVSGENIIAIADANLCDQYRAIFKECQGLIKDLPDRLQLGSEAKWGELLAKIKSLAGVVKQDRPKGLGIPRPYPPAQGK